MISYNSCDKAWGQNYYLPSFTDKDTDAQREVVTRTSWHSEAGQKLEVKEDPQPLLHPCVILSLLLMDSSAGTAEARCLVEEGGNRRLSQKIVSRNSLGWVILVILGMLQERVNVPSLEASIPWSRGCHETNIPFPRWDSEGKHHVGYCRWEGQSFDFSTYIK